LASDYPLAAEGVGKSFGRLDVLKSASVWAEPGRISTLMGRNGSGKTTLLRIAVGDLRPDYGALHFRGRASERHALPKLARNGLLFVPQRGICAPRFTVRDHFRALDSAYDLGDPAPSIELAGLGSLVDQRVHELSGGERARVSFGLVHYRRPTVLVADEPLVGLAPIDRDPLFRILRALADVGCAVVTSGHDAVDLLRLSDVIVWSVAGTTHHLGSPEEALAHAQFRREYLGPGVRLD
jgi:ABC-type multidrug transport system ATPase subunit